MLGAWVGGFALLTIVLICGDPDRCVLACMNIAHTWPEVCCALTTVLPLLLCSCVTATIFWATPMCSSQRLLHLLLCTFGVTVNQTTVGRVDANKQTAHKHGALTQVHSEPTGVGHPSLLRWQYQALFLWPTQPHRAGVLCSHKERWGAGERYAN